MGKFFKVKEHGSTVRTEFLAGLTTFFAMVYILMVNAGMFSDIANAAAFLASPESGFITGQVLGVNGGFLI